MKNGQYIQGQIAPIHRYFNTAPKNAKISRAGHPYCDNIR